MTRTVAVATATQSPVVHAAPRPVDNRTVEQQLVDQFRIMALCASAKLTAKASRRDDVVMATVCSIVALAEVAGITLCL